MVKPKVSKRSTEKDTPSSNYIKVAMLRNHHLFLQRSGYHCFIPALDLMMLLIEVGQHLGGRDVLDRLVAELEVLLDGDGVLDLEPDDGRGDEEGAA